MADCFENLFDQRELVRAIYAGSEHRAEERLVFHLDGSALSAWLDLVYQRPDGGLTIIDWKVSASETSDYSYQLHTYALAVLRSLLGRDIPPVQIHLYEANLLKN